MTVRIYVEGGGDHNKDLTDSVPPGLFGVLSEGWFGGPYAESRGVWWKTIAPMIVFGPLMKNAGTDDLLNPLGGQRGASCRDRPVGACQATRGDGWQRPGAASQDQIHLMVQAMEAWFHADKEKLKEYFGQGFRLAALKPRPDIDNIPKADLFAGMQIATRDCLKKGEYSKGQHSFEILALIDPVKVKAASPVHAGRLFSVLDRKCVP